MNSRPQSSTRAFGKCVQGLFCLVFPATSVLGCAQTRHPVEAQLTPTRHVETVVPPDEPQPTDDSPVAHVTSAPTPRRAADGVIPVRWPSVGGAIEVSSSLEGQPTATVGKITSAARLNVKSASFHAPLVAAPPTELEAETNVEVELPERKSESIDYFLTVALQNHPKLLAARQRVAAASNVIPQARALPDPTFNNTFWPLHDQALQTAGGRVGNQMSINQMVPFPDKLKTKAAIASREVQIAQTEVERIEKEIIEAVRIACYEVWFANRALEINEESKGLVSELTSVAEARYRSGGSQQDVLRARLETDRLEDQRISLQKQKEMALSDLATLLRQPAAMLPEPDKSIAIANTTQQLDDLLSRALECNPQLRGLELEIYRDRQRQQLACLQQYPDFTVGLNWGLISDGHNVISPVANGHDNLSIGFGTTLPLWREKINAGVREAAHRVSSTTHRYDSERDELQGRLRRLLVQADALVQQREVYVERIIPRTKETLTLAVADYRGERATFFSLIDIYRELLMFETQLARLDANLWSILAQIDRAVGCDVR
jgi:outer membrane protein, heavy metal efflux system